MKLIALTLFIAALSVLFSSSSARGISKNTLNQLPAALLDTRIIGGSEVSEGFATYQVAIANTFGELVCGGSIIAPQWILTAAHCMDWPKQFLRIITGSVNWQKPDAEYTVDDVKIHCLYNTPMYHNDIALLHLSKPIVYNERTQPVALANSNKQKEGDKLILTGWGSTKVWGKNPDILHKVNLKYYPHDKCEKGVKNAAWLGAGHICSFTKSGEGSCHGDSGGPLVNADNVQVGVVNFGEPCAIGYPDAYASVAYYHDWIRSILNGGSSTC